MLGTFSCAYLFAQIIYAAADMYQRPISVTAVKPHKQKQLGRKGLMWFMCPQRTWHRTEAGTGGVLPTGLLLVACSCCFHNQLRVTCLVATLPTVSWASSHQSLILTGIFSLEVLPSQMILASVRLSCADVPMLFM